MLGYRNQYEYELSYKYYLFLGYFLLFHLFFSARNRNLKIDKKKKQAKRTKKKGTGGPDFYLPEMAGFPIGGTNGVKYGLLDIHYDNVNTKKKHTHTHK